MEHASIADEVDRYLRSSKRSFERGSDEYYARRALGAALQAFRRGNYGIGAVAVLRENGQAREFIGGNAMVTGSGVIDHAETRAILRIAARRKPDDHYDLPPKRIDGLFVYGTLEPCPMCASVLTNAGATRSVSTVLDGALVTDHGYKRSGGAANVVGNKANSQPRVWQQIQQGRGMQFEVLETQDDELQSLSERIFLETREQIDRLLTDRTHVGHAAVVRQTYADRVLS